MFTTPSQDSCDLSGIGLEIRECPQISCYGGFAEVYSKWSTFTLHGLGKRAVLVFSDSKSKDGNKMGNITLESLYWRKVEKFGIQFSLQVGKKKKNSTDNEQH